MLFFTDILSVADETKMLVTALIVIIYLIILALIEVNKDEKDISRTFDPIILIFVVIFGFIVITKVIGILK